MNLGKQIHTYRLRASLTQEKLAEALHVTAQAVSKWETNAGYPDITILPRLAAALGVTVDELFETSVDVTRKRIEQLLENKTCLTHEEFVKAEAQLKEGCLDRESRGACLTALADLYHHRAQSYLEQSGRCAEEALELEPEKKDNHWLLTSAWGGVLWDWTGSNHTRIIDYYKTFVKQHPRYWPGYLWLMDNLIADGRLEEASEALEQMKPLDAGFRYLLYKGWIAKAGGHWDQAEALWEEMTARYPEDWMSWSSRADAYAKEVRYAEAIAAYQKAADLQAPPRFTDNYDSIAQLCRITGDKQGAIAACERVVQILREDWQMSEGETVRGYLENIKELKNT